MPKGVQGATDLTTSLPRIHPVTEIRTVLEQIVFTASRNYTRSIKIDGYVRGILVDALKRKEALDAIDGEKSTYGQ